ncbi:hypothetical protein FOZ60_007510 [Perkinsus olseni]|uniref:Uncharacterized protein n=1 Tax=Perkinsus olseni TaxID=32597 RepID=A0A7J6PMQ8_PEROL|nr:hypothetical protein FOZ60_007510 [Perkinsus olseni]
MSLPSAHMWRTEQSEFRCQRRESVADKGKRGDTWSRSAMCRRKGVEMMAVKMGYMKDVKRNFKFVRKICRRVQCTQDLTDSQLERNEKVVRMAKKGGGKGGGSSHGGLLAELISWLQSARLAFANGTSGGKAMINPRVP